MRSGSRALFVLAALAGFAAGEPSALAQFFEPPRWAPPGYQAAPGGGYYPVPPAPQPRRRAQPQGAYPGAQVQPAPAPPRGYNLRRMLGFEESSQPPPLPEAPRPRLQPRPRAAAPAVARQEKPKVEPQTFVVVFGDGLADLAGQGLVDAFDDIPEVEVARRTRGEGGLVRSDVSDWPKLIQEALGAIQKTTVAVMLVGANDRQAIREGDVSHEPLSDRWREIYRERVDAVVRAFQERGVPFVWIGAPPMKNDKASADLIAMNEIFRDRTQKAGGTYVDIWPGFVNDANQYTAMGPDLAGQPARLRANDGVNFTRAGGRKVAFFADAEIKRLIEQKRGGSDVAGFPPAGASAQPDGASAPGAGSPLDQAGQSGARSFSDAPVAPAARPLAGPVVPLTRPDLSPGGTLVSTRPRLEGDSASTAQKILREGVAPAPRPGRADDFRWPRS